MEDNNNVREARVNAYEENVFETRSRISAKMRDVARLMSDVLTLCDEADAKFNDIRPYGDMFNDCLPIRSTTDDACGGYPFHVSFSDVCLNVLAWADEMNALNEQKVVYPNERE